MSLKKQVLYLMNLLMPKVSVIIPTYNRGYIIRQAIESVLKQALRDLELLIIDDGSTDNTGEVIKSIFDPRIRYFYKQNGGPASARNVGLSNAKGEFIAFLDSDDFWPENYIQIMLFHLENNNKFGMAYSPITLIYPDGRETKSYKGPEGKSGWITLDLFKRGFIWPSAVVFRNSIWKEFYFDESLNKVSEDSDAFLRLSIRTPFLFVPDVQAFHRLTSDSISVEAGVSCARMLVLERFYFKLGGDRIIPVKIARRRLSHACRKIAEDRRIKGSRSAALKLYKHAIHYWPFDLRLYLGLGQALLLSRSKDQEPNWNMPQPLGNPIGPNRFV
jgi:glycosyltransferase involved in cell wall biosynthesis